MSSENETVAEIVKRINDQVIQLHQTAFNNATEYSLRITLHNFLIAVCDYAHDIETAHRREVAELKKRCEEYERQPELMAETAKAALELLKSQDAKIAELRECLAGTLEVVDSTVASLGIAEKVKSNEDYKRWRKALEGVSK